MKYQIVFHSGSYKCVDAETSSYEQAQEIRSELQAQMYLGGERDFYYSIEEVKDNDIDDDILEDDDFNSLCGR